MAVLKAPFPYFGGKSRIAHEVWARFGDVANYVEPFFGTGAVLLARPGDQWCNGRTETVNDLNGYISNFWRAVQRDPNAVAYYADWPVNENDLHARHAWLVTQRDDIQSKLEGDPDWFNAKIAGWWVWGVSCWIGSGFCSGEGPWQQVNGELVNVKGDAGRGVNRKLPHLGNAGQGVNRKLLHLGGAGRGVNRKRPHLGSAGQGVNSDYGLNHVSKWMTDLSDRLRRVRVCCGDWQRVCGKSVTFTHGVTGVFLDPPYSAEAGRAECYGHTEDMKVAHAARAWAIEHGANPLMRIALCGYDGEHEMPDDWQVVEWKANGGFGSQRKNGVNENAHRERIWFSPACENVVEQQQLTL